MDERQPINYIYFGILFVLLAFVHIYHLFLIEGSPLFHRWFYVFCSIGQCFLEIGALVVINRFLARYFKRGINEIFIVLTFLLFLAHLVDFPMIRILGMTIWYVFDFIFAESLENFIEMLYATNLSIMSWILAGVALLVLPVLGVLFFRLGERWSRKKSLKLNDSTLGISLVVGLVALTLVDGLAYRLIAPKENSHYLKALPWKTTLFSETKLTLKVGRLKGSSSETAQQAVLTELSLKAVRRPNIFLFVAESLRDDVLTKDVAPALAKFKAKNRACCHSLSAANGTHLSWFSLFHSVYPFYWGERHPGSWKSGSLPLQILKKSGYKVHVYSASRLRYYQMDERLFGKEHELADTFQVFGLDAAQENHENDSACMSALMQDLDKSKEGHLFIVFLDSTHFGYSWPSHEALEPAPSEIDYLKIAYSNEQAESVKTRYRNAVHFVDSLFGRFWKKLKQSPAGKEAVVVFTGDHGEEFFEEGRMFHASNLNTMQTHVPIYYRLGSKKSHANELSSHLDIFPTLLHHVFGKEVCEEWFDGESLLKPRRKNFVISTRYNASRAPYEFLIHNGKKQLIARFKDRSNILNSRALEVVACRDENDQPLDLKLEHIQSEFQEPLEVLFR